MTSRLPTFSPCPGCQRLNRVPVADDGRQPVCGNCKTALPLHGAINELSASGLIALIERAPIPVLADFWAPWCGPCRAFAPTFEATARQWAGQLVFAKVDTQAQPLAATTYGIRGIPTLIAFRDGREVERISGALPGEQLARWINTVIRPARAA